MYNCNNMVNNQQPQMAYIDVLNYGGFVARFWGSYDFMGKTENFYVDGFPVGQERRVDIPVGATNVHVVMEEAVFLWSWQLICERTYKVADEYCFVVYGLTFAPYCAEVPCTSPGLIKDIFPPGVFIEVDSCNNLVLDNRNTCSATNTIGSSVTVRSCNEIPKTNCKETRCNSCLNDYSNSIMNSMACMNVNYYNYLSELYDDYVKEKKCKK